LILTAAGSCNKKCEHARTHATLVAEQARDVALVVGGCGFGQPGVLSDEVCWSWDQDRTRAWLQSLASGPRPASARQVAEPVGRRGMKHGWVGRGGRLGSAGHDPKRM